MNPNGSQLHENNITVSNDLAKLAKMNPNGSQPPTNDATIHAGYTTMILSRTPPDDYESNDSRTTLQD